MKISRRDATVVVAVVVVVVATCLASSIGVDSATGEKEKGATTIKTLLASLSIASAAFFFGRHKTHGDGTDSVDDDNDDDDETMSANFISETATACDASRPDRRPLLVMDVDETMLHSIIPDGTQIPTDENDDEIRPALRRRIFPDVTTIVRRREGDEYSESEPTTILDGGFFVAELRPGIRRFLHVAAQKFDLCVCSIGARYYVARIVSALDPDGTLFGDRVLDRADLGPRLIKSIPQNWMTGRERGCAIAIDDQPERWDSTATVIRIAPFEGGCSIARNESAYLDSLATLLDEALDSSTWSPSLSEALRAVMSLRALVAETSWTAKFPLDEETPRSTVDEEGEEKKLCELMRPCVGESDDDDDGTGEDDENECDSIAMRKFVDRCEKKRRRARHRLLIAPAFFSAFANDDDGVSIDGAERDGNDDPDEFVPIFLDGDCLDAEFEAMHADEDSDRDVRPRPMFICSRQVECTLGGTKLDDGGA